MHYDNYAVKCIYGGGVIRGWTAVEFPRIIAGAESSWTRSRRPLRSKIRPSTQPTFRRTPQRKRVIAHHENFVVKTPGDLRRVGSFEEQRNRLDEVCSRFFNGCTLARDIELRAQRHKSVALTLDNRGEALCWLHDPSLPQFHLAVLSQRYLRTRFLRRSGTLRGEGRRCVRRDGAQHSGQYGIMAGPVGIGARAESVGAGDAQVERPARSAPPGPGGSGLRLRSAAGRPVGLGSGYSSAMRSEEHTSELQSLRHLVCRLL